MIPIILIDRPRAGNRINASTAEELAGLCSNFEHDGESRCIIVTGAGRKYFCAGADSSLVSSQGGSGPPDPVVAVADVTLPVIAALNGSALDLGLEIALACDIRIASESALFGFPMVEGGRLPCNGGTQRLPRLVGRGRALQMLLTGETVTAREACAMGLVDEVAPPDQVMKRAEEIATGIAQRAPIAARYAKEAINKGLDMPLDQGLRMEGDLYLLLQTTADRTEGVTAFLKKRKAEFKGE